MPPEHRLFLLEMMEKDDISVVSEGLIGPCEIPLDAIRENFGEWPYHKFRRFVRKSVNGFSFLEKQNGFVSMKLPDFVTYLRLRQANKGAPFSFCDAGGKEHRIENVADVVLYMIDCDVPKFLPKLNEDYRDHFKIKKILPGGKFCMMNSVSGR